MTKSQLNSLEIAEKENAQAIATFMNRWLQPRGITAVATRQDSCLQVTFEAAELPNVKVLVVFIRKVLINLGIATIKKVKIYVCLAGESSPVFYEEIELRHPEKLQLKEGASAPPADSLQINEPASKAGEFDKSMGAAAPNPLSWLNEKPGKISIILAVFLGASAILWFNLNRERPSPTRSAPAPAVSLPVNFFQQAVNRATSASNLAQTAQSQEEWKLIATHWGEALNLMQSVPASDANYQLAQQKVKEYQRKLKYAQQKATANP